MRIIADPSGALDRRSSGGGSEEAARDTTSSNTTPAVQRPREINRKRILAKQGMALSLSHALDDVPRESESLALRERAC